VATLFSIGHSTRTLEEFLGTLKAHGIQTLADIRAFPASRRLPHFGRESLEEMLPADGISYIWMKDLGGYRKRLLDDSPNMALRNQSFRNYADYMLTPQFEKAVGELVDAAQYTRVVYMCAERHWSQCHRMLVSDWLVAHGHRVLHIDGAGEPKPHRLMAEARLVDGQVLYQGDLLF